MSLSGHCVQIAAMSDLSQEMQSRWAESFHLWPARLGSADARRASRRRDLEELVRTVGLEPELPSAAALRIASAVCGGRVESGEANRIPRNWRGS